MSGLLLVAALQVELRGVPTDLADVERFVCGVGRKGAERAIAHLEARRPARVLQVGFAGGLRAGLTEGDLLLVTEVFAAGEVPPPVPSSDLDRLRGALARLPRRLAQGSLVTVPAFVHRPEDKRALAERHQAVACDMEGAWVALACADRGIPWCGVRAISDGVDQRLLPSLRSEKGIDPVRFAKALASPAAPWRGARMV
ncbi:MAG: hypothetical protein KDA24_08690, partial [Deltaproteobacteria bacterium]|nr:hypothetical protein [Deltaproteobacteria bacterium]